MKLCSRNSGGHLLGTRLQLGVDDDTRISVALEAFQVRNAAEAVQPINVPGTGKKPSVNEMGAIRRCRPLLGTFVEIIARRSAGLQPGARNMASLNAPNLNSALPAAIDRAFAAIERVQCLMSAHDPDSELSQVNAEAFLRPVKVSSDSFDVLERGLDIARASGGAFDFTIAPVLASWGLLPAHLCRHAHGNWRDVILNRGQRVRFARPLAIDLGGIAKGFAVDAAIASLRADKVTSASVNAGGDLRVFGRDAWHIHLRHPVSAQPVAGLISLRNAALATSSSCFSRRSWRGRAISHLIDPGTHRAITAGLSVSVRASQCWIADVLTKVVLNADTATATRLLKAHDAKALILAT